MVQGDGARLDGALAAMELVRRLGISRADAAVARQFYRHVAWSVHVVSVRRRWGRVHNCTLQVNLLPQDAEHSIVLRAALAGKSCRQRRWPHLATFKRSRALELEAHHLEVLRRGMLAIGAPANLTQRGRTPCQ